MGNRYFALYSFLPLQFEKRRERRWRVVSRSEGYQRVTEELKEMTNKLKEMTKESEARRKTTQKSLIVLIIGGLLIYTLRDKKR